MAIYSVITGTGSYVPPVEMKNEDFLSYEFYDDSGEPISTPTSQIIEKFKDITTIETRRYASKEQSTSDLALYASQNAIADAGIDKEELDYILVAQNFGETHAGSISMEMLPSLASRLKAKLQINNPFAVAYDIVFGCPGWVQAMIQADYFIKSGDAKKILVVGADILSRVSDPHDRDSMIYADGAGAVILEAHETQTPVGMLAHISRSDAIEYADMLFMGRSYKKDVAEKNELYLKMYGRRLYQYALELVPSAIKAGLDKVDIHIDKVKKVLIHQANGKMDDAILKRLYRLYGIKDVPSDVMPMSISWLGNSSVATVPTLLDLVAKDNMEGHAIGSGDIIVLASVGAGMNINTIVYKLP
ncbi:MAG: 3-oxoacyl-ACP synthase III family protein [Paludibacteraceae bacterium]